MCEEPTFPLRLFFSFSKLSTCFLFADKSCSEICVTDNPRRKNEKKRERGKCRAFARTSRISCQIFMRNNLTLNSATAFSCPKPVDLILEESLSRHSDVLCKLFYPLLTSSHTTTRRLDALGVSSARHLRHCSPTVRHELLYNHNLCGPTACDRGTTDYDRKFDFSFLFFNSAAHITLNSLHFAGD